jgi:hypothetical protein
LDRKFVADSTRAHTYYAHVRTSLRVKANNSFDIPTMARASSTSSDMDIDLFSDAESSSNTSSDEEMERSLFPIIFVAELGKY